MSSATLGFLFTQMVKAPLLVVYIVGIVLAFIRYSTQGRSMLLAGCGFFLFALGWAIDAARMYWLLAIRPAVEEIARIGMLSQFASHLVELGGLILIMLALFSRPAMNRS